MSETKNIVSRDEKEDLNIEDFTKYFEQSQNYLDYSKELNSLTSISSQINFKLFIENVFSKSIILPLNIINIEKLQIYYSEKNEKKKPLYSYNTPQKEEVEYEMGYYPNYTPTEIEFYNQLTLEEKREWNALSSEDKQFNLELISSEGQESLKGLCKKLDSCIEKVEKLTLFGI